MSDRHIGEQTNPKISREYCAWKIDMNILSNMRTSCKERHRLAEI